MKLSGLLAVMLGFGMTLCAMDEGATQTGDALDAQEEIV